MKHNKQNIFLITIIIFILYRISFQYINRNNVIYIPDFLTNKEHNYIKQLNTDKEGFIFEKFRYIKPLNNPTINKIFYSPQKIKRINKILKKKVFKSKFPIEHRIYSEDSNGMDWHIDTLLYDKPQYEAVYTINNESNSFTEWIDFDGRLHTQWTGPNSLLLVKAKGYKHHVSPTIDGERHILKLIYTQSNEENSNYHKELERFKKIK